MVRIRRSHRRGRGEPRLGNYFAFANLRIMSVEINSTIIEGITIIQLGLKLLSANNLVPIGKFKWAATQIDLFEINAIQNK